LVTSFQSAGGGRVPRPASGAAPLANYYSTTLGLTQLFGPFQGDGRIGFSGGHLIAPSYRRVTAPPATLGTYSADGEATAFDSDFTGHLVMDTHLEVGAIVVPVTGYWQPQTLSPIYNYMVNEAGGNTSPTDNDGRTGVHNYFGTVKQNGGGDATVFFGTAFINASCGTRTNVMGCPEGGLLGGSGIVAQDFGHFEAVGDIDLKDNGHQASMWGNVRNYTRTNSVGDKNTGWVGDRQQSVGSKPIDAIWSASGPINIGLDLVGASFPDFLLQTITMQNGGTGYTGSIGGNNQSGDIVCASGGTADTTTCIRVLTVDGSGTILTWALERAGKYTVIPSTPNTFTGGTGSGAIFTLGYTTGGVAVAMPAGSCIYADATRDGNVYGSSFPWMYKLGNTRMCYGGNLAAWNFVVGNTSALQVYNNQVIAPVKFVSLAGIKQATRSIASGSSDALSAATDQTVYWNSASGAQKAEAVPLCNTGTDGTDFIVKDQIGDANLHAIVLTPISPSLIDGNASYSITFSKGAVEIKCDGVSGNWQIMSKIAA